MKGHKNLQDSGNITYPDLLVIQEPTCKCSPNHALNTFYCMNVKPQLQKRKKKSLSSAVATMKTSTMTCL